jgi:Methylase involved in ubiquinone/menaquinone biosynthesis
VQTAFDGQANRWDTEYRVRRARTIASEIEKRGKLGKGQAVIDFGCGTGLISFNLLDAIGSIAFVDSSREMLEAVRGKVHASKIEDRARLENDIFSKSLEASPYDCVYSSMALHHVRDLDGLAKRFGELLKPKGEVCIVDLMPDDGSFHKNEAGFDGYNGFDPAWLSGLFEKQGFVERYRDVFFSDMRQIGGSAVPYSLFILVMTK